MRSAGSRKQAPAIETFRERDGAGRRSQPLAAGRALAALAPRRLLTDRQDIAAVRAGRHQCQEPPLLEEGSGIGHDAGGPAEPLIVAVIALGCQVAVMDVAGSLGLTETVQASGDSRTGGALGKHFIRSP